MHYVILFNLERVNGVDSLKPFLRNLFMDTAILRLLYGVRRMVTALIIGIRSFKKFPYAFIIYQSSLLAETKKQ